MDTNNTQPTPENLSSHLPQATPEHTTHFTWRKERSRYSDQPIYMAYPDIHHKDMADTHNSNGILRVFQDTTSTNPDSTFVWIALSTHRPDKAGIRHSLDTAKHAAETYYLRGVAR